MKNLSKINNKLSILLFRSYSLIHQLAEKSFNAFVSSLPIKSGSNNSVSRGSATTCLHSRGFTLIELLVVIAIISILASFLTANFIGARQRARDAQRKSDLRQMQAALEMFRADAGCYPDGTCPVAASGLDGCTGRFQTSVSPATVYMEKVPCDPLGNSGGVSGNNPHYRYTSTATGYRIYACVENPSDPDIDTSGENPSIVCNAGRYRIRVTQP